MTRTPTPPAPQREYVIDNDMLTTWRTGCVQWRDNNPDKSCRGCEFDGKGARKNCCDFDDDAMQKIFQSNPITKASSDHCDHEWCCPAYWCLSVMHNGPCEHKKCPKGHDTRFRPVSPAPASIPEHTNDISCIKCFHCNKQVSTYHSGIIFRGIAVCPECVESGKDTEEASRAAADAATKELLEIEKMWRNDPHPSRDILNPFLEVCVQCVKDIGYEDSCCDPSECLADAQSELRRHAPQQGDPE